MLTKIKDLTRRAFCFRQSSWTKTFGILRTPNSKTLCVGSLRIGLLAPGTPAAYYPLNGCRSFFGRKYTHVLSEVTKVNRRSVHFRLFDGNHVNCKYPLVKFGTRGEVLAG